MSVVLAHPWFLTADARRRIDGWIDAYQQRDPLGRSPTRLLLFGPADCGQRRVVEHIANECRLPIRDISLAAWRTQAPGPRLRALRTWASETPTVIMLRPDPWLTQPSDLLHADPWLITLLEWVDTVPNHSWAILRTPDRPRVAAIRRRFDDMLGIAAPATDIIVEWAFSTLDPSASPARVGPLAQLMAGFSWGDIVWVGALAHTAWVTANRLGSPLDYVSPAINMRQQLLRDT